MADDAVDLKDWDTRASRESRLRNVLFGSIPDVAADEADCSVACVRGLRSVPLRLLS